MSVTPEDPCSVPVAAAGGDRYGAGRFSYDSVTDTWDWDAEVYRIHGLQPGSVPATTEMILRSKHPADRERVRALLEQAVQGAISFSISYRLIRDDGDQRRVVLVGESRVDEQGARIEGFYLDLTPDFDEETEEATRTAFESLEHRAVIEQAKGIVMVVYGIDARAAFAMLRWWSRNRNTKIRDLAQRLVDTVAEGQHVQTDVQTSVDALLHDITTP